MWARAVSAEGAWISAPHTMHSARPLPPGLFPTRNSCSQDTCCLGSSELSLPASRRLGLGGGIFSCWATKEERRGKVKCLERLTWKFITLYVKQIGNGNLLYDSGNSNRDAVTI